MFMDTNVNWNSDLSKWSTSSATSFLAMFQGATSFNSNTSNWNTISAREMSGMFERCENFQGHGLETWDVSKVTSINSMFRQAENLDFDVSLWNTARVKNMNHAFQDARTFRGIGLDEWNGMFKYHIQVQKCEDISFSPHFSFQHFATNTYRHTKTSHSIRRNARRI